MHNKLLDFDVFSAVRFAFALTLQRTLVRVFILSPILVTACLPNSAPADRGEVRFRVDVTLVEKGVLRKGSSVWLYSLNKSNFPLTQTYRSYFEAEAIQIRLSNNQWAFVLPSNVQGNHTASKWPELAFGFSSKVRTERRGAEAIGQLGAMYGRKAHIICIKDTEIASFKPGDIICPSVIVSDQISEPRSFRLVDHAAHNAQADVPKIASITITITSLPVTRRLEATLPWLREASHRFHKRPANFYAYMRGVPQYVMRIREPFFRK